MANALVKESGHWYTREGAPAYEQPNKSKPGQMRPTTIRDAKKLDLVPSVTTILGMAARPALERWKLNQLMLAALTMPAVEGESLQEYESRLWEDANAQAKEARDKGTEIHGYIESYYDKGANEDNPYVVAVRKALTEVFGEQNWNAEKSFASIMGYGGKIDLYSDEVVIDYKTKDFTEKDMKKPMAYLENKMQLSAYRRGLFPATYESVKMANVFISRELQENGFPLVKIEQHEEDCWAHFNCLLTYWQLVKGR